MTLRSMIVLFLCSKKQNMKVVLGQCTFSLFIDKVHVAKSNLFNLHNCTATIVVNIIV